MALRALPAKQIGPRRRALRALTPYYSRSTDRRKEFVLGEKPGVLREVGRLDQKAWKQYETLLRRERTPLEQAEFYTREMEARRMRSYRALSLLLGEPVNRVGRHIKLLGLPEPVKAFLRERREPRYLRYFTERRLQDLVRMGNSRAAWRRFRQMVQEADREAGIWKGVPQAD